MLENTCLDPKTSLQLSLENWRKEHPDVVTPVIWNFWQQWLQMYFSSPIEENEKQGDIKNIIAQNPQSRLRKYLADRYLKGQGIEVGALHNPLPVPEAAEVSYLDRMSNEWLRRHYVELNHLALVDVDIIDDGEILASIEDKSLDFIIANHFLEHCENPLQTLQNHLRVLKKGGILYYALPDKAHTFDASRDMTSFDHIMQDYENGINISRQAHYQDWSLNVSHKQGQEHEAWWRFLEIAKYSIHFHVWGQREAMEFLLLSGDFLKKSKNIEFRFEAFFQNQDENIFILQAAK